jgi:tRNA(Ile)-lysidine synthase
MTSLAEQVRERRPNLEGFGILAVSGGADSVALLRVLVEIYPNSRLMVAHMNHQLRGAESAGDEAFVRQLAHAHELQFRSTSVDVRTLAARGENLEDTARTLRYEWLTQLAGENKVSWIATGHTADDQAETVLHRILRGTGLQGLRGIARERDLAPGLKLVRPLLHASRPEIVDYLNSIKQSWREDTSNRDPQYTRNRIRHELLPLLETFNPAIRSLLGRLAEQAGEAHAEQEHLAKSLLAEVELPRAGSMVVLDAERLRSMPRQRVRTMFRLIWTRENWPLDAMTFDHWNRLVDEVAESKAASDFPGRIRLNIRKGVVQLYES